MTYLFDTSVLISHLRNSLPSASEWTQKAEQRQVIAAVSVITAYEIWKGAVTPRHVLDYKLLFSHYTIHPLSKQIASIAAENYRALPKEHQQPYINLDLLIAATAEYYRLSLVTTNKKHYETLNLPHVKLIFI